MKCLLISMFVTLAVGSAMARADEPATQPAAKVFALHLTNVPVKQAIEELARQSGIQLRTREVATERANQRRADFNFENLSFWMAMAQILDPLSARPQEFSSDPPSMMLVAEAPGWTLPYFFVQGPVAITLNRIHRSADINYALQQSATPDECRLSFEVFPLPTLGATPVVTIKINRCVDETGALITAPAAESARADRFPIRPSARVLPGTAKTLMELQGDVILHLSSGEDKSFPFTFQNIPVPPLRAAAKLPATQPAPPLPAPTPELAVDYTKQINKLLLKLESVSSDERQVGRIGLAMLPPEAFTALDTAANRKDLPPSVSGPLNSLRLKQKSWLIPRRKRMKLEHETGEWEEKLALDTYARMGHRDPAWDQQVVDAIHAYFLCLERRDVPRIRFAFEQALAAGCDDPMVLSLAGYAFEKGGTDLDTIYALYSKAGAEMRRQSYPAIFRFWNATHHAELRQQVNTSIIEDRKLDEGKVQAVNSEEQKQIAEQETEALSLWPDALHEDLPRLVLSSGADQLIRIFTKPGRDADRAYRVLMAALETAKPGEEFLLRTRGRYFRDFAWQGRISGPGHTLRAQNRDLYESRLGEAETYLVKAYNMDPTDSQPAEDMLDVCLGRAYPKNVMEDWFEKAMRADPDNVEACLTKQNYVRPAWYGTGFTAQQFGDDVFAGENWRGALPFLKAVKHDGLITGDNLYLYFGKPEVWTEFRDVFEPYLLAEPDDIEMRARYCWWACRAAQWDVARKHFEMLGGYSPIHRLHNPDQIKNLREQAAKVGG